MKKIKRIIGIGIVALVIISIFSFIPQTKVKTVESNRVFDVVWNSATYVVPGSEFAGPLYILPTFFSPAFINRYCENKCFRDWDGGDTNDLLDCIENCRIKYLHMEFEHSIDCGCN